MVQISPLFDIPPPRTILVSCQQLTVSISLTTPSLLLVNVSICLTPHSLTLLMDSPLPGESVL